MSLSRIGLALLNALCALAVHRVATRRVTCALIVLLLVACKPSTQSDTTDTSSNIHFDNADLGADGKPARGDLNSVAIEIFITPKTLAQLQSEGDFPDYLGSGLLRGNASHILVTAAHVAMYADPQKRQASTGQQDDECDEEKKLHTHVCVYTNETPSRKVCENADRIHYLYPQGAFVRTEYGENISDAHDLAAMVWPSVIVDSGPFQLVNPADTAPALGSTISVNGAKWNDEQVSQRSNNQMQTVARGFPVSNVLPDLLESFEPYQVVSDLVTFSNVIGIDHPGTQHGDSGGPALSKTSTNRSTLAATVLSVPRQIPLCPFITGCKVPDVGYEEDFTRDIAHFKTLLKEARAGDATLRFYQYVEEQRQAFVRSKKDPQSASNTVFYRNRFLRTDLNSANGGWLDRTFRHCDAVNPLPLCDQMP